MSSSSDAASMDIASDGIGSREINFTPHFHALTNAGKSHFSRVADATAELIDNSIQACTNNTDERNVVIGVHTVGKQKIGKPKVGYLTVLDNGCGMDVNGLREFATYSLDQATRGQHGTAANRSFISKFGVGAKQAGFFLGDIIHVFTKQRSSGDVLELTLDKAGFQERFARQEDVFTRPVHFHTFTGTLPLTPEQKSMSALVEQVEEHVRKYRQFTVIIVKLNEARLTTLLTQAMLNGMSSQLQREMPRDLAEIYHFHLHTEHRINAIIRMPKFNPQKDRIKGFDYPKIVSNASDKVHGAPLSIEVSFSEDGKKLVDKLDLKDIDDTVSQCVSRAAAVFPFTMKIPNPHPSDVLQPGAPVMSQAVARQLDGEHTSGLKHGTNTVEGIIFYFPNVDGHETRPGFSNESEDKQLEERTTSSSSNKADPIADDAAAASSQVEPTLNALLYPGTRRDENPTFNIFWQDRLVPESSAKTLPLYFPECHTRSQCAQANLPEKWDRRLKGFLFFDWTFEHISNNKLKIQIPDFNEWLYQKRKEILYYPLNRANILKFLQGCYLHFDRELMFDERMIELETDIKSPNPKKKNAVKVYGDENSAYFKRLVVANGKFTVRVGDLVKFNCSGKGQGGTRKIFARVMAFEVGGGLHVAEDKFCGAAKLTYIREPVELFGGAISSDHPLVGLIDFSGTEDKWKPTKRELEAVRDLAPDFIEVWLFSNCGNDSKDLLEDNVVYAGTEYWKIGVQIFDKNRNFCLNVPQSNGKYQVEMFMEDESWGVSQKMYYFDPQKNEDVIYVPSKEKKGGRDQRDDLYFSFYGKSGGRPGSSPLIFNGVGTFKCKFVVTIEDARDVLVTERVVNFKVSPMAISDFLLETEGADWQALLPLGTTLPPLSLTFTDGINKVEFIGRLQVKFYSSDESMELTCDEVQNPIFDMSAEDGGVLPFQDQWLAVPIEGKGPFFLKSRKQPVENQRRVKFYVDVYLPENPTIDEHDVTDDMFNIKLGVTKSFDMTFVPGHPARIELLTPNEQPLDLSNGGVVPEIRFVVLDAWGNKTTPHAGSSWQISIDSDGPLTPNRPLPVLASGEAFLYDACVSVKDAIPFQGAIYEQKFTFEDVTDAERIIRLESFILNIQVNPTQFPEEIQILHDGRPISQPWILPVGSKLSNMSFRMLDESGLPIDFDPAWFEDKASCVKTSAKPPCEKWTVKEGKSKRGKITNPSLPDIELQQKIYDSGGEIKFEVSIFLARGKFLEQEFTITLLPDEPSRWHMTFSKKDAQMIEIMNGDEIDLHSKVNKIVLSDQHENVVPISSPVEPAPYLVVTWNDPELDSSWKSAIPNALQPSKRKKAAAVVVRTSASKRARKGRARSSNADDMSVARALDADLDTVSEGDDDGDDDDVDQEQEEVEELNSDKTESSAQISAISLPLSYSNGFYVIEAGQSILAPPHVLTPCSTWLIVGGGHFRMYKIKFMLMSGAPKTIKMDIGRDNEPERASTNEVSLTRFSELKNVLLTFHDGGGQLANLKLAKGFNYSITSIAPGQSEPITLMRDAAVKNSRFTIPSIKISKQIDALPENVTTFDIIANASYHLGTASTGSSSSSSAVHPPLVNLDPTILHCTVVNLNSVTAIIATVIETETRLTISSDGALQARDAAPMEVESAIATAVLPSVRSRRDSSSYTVSAEQPYPSIQLTFDTENGEPYSPASLECLQLKVELIKMAAGLKDPRPRDWTHCFDFSFDDQSNQYFVLSRLQQSSSDAMETSDEAPGVNDLSLPAGLYNFTFYHIEKRKSLVSLLPAAKQRVHSNIKIRLLAGQPVSIGPSPGCNAVHENLSASNSSEFSHRVILDGLSMSLFDSKDNICSIPDGFNIACTLRHPIAGSSNTVLPQLESVDSTELPDASYLLGQIDKSGHKTVFSRLAVAAGTGVGNGEVELMVSYVRIDSATGEATRVEDIDPIVFPFQFNTNADRAAATTEASKRSKDLQAEVVEFDAKVKELEDDLRQFDREIKAALKHGSHDNLARFKAARESVGFADLNAGLASLEKQQNDMHALRSQVRPAFIDKSIAKPDGDAHLMGTNNHGFVGELGYVDNILLARILSWAAASQIDCTLVDTNEASVQLYRAGYKSWALEQIMPFEIRGHHSTGRLRNSDERKAQYLPLPSLASAPGNARYLVNLIQLLPEQEHFRETVFYAVFGNSILFDDIESAMLYRKGLIEQKKRAPTLYTLNGERVGADGILNPRKQSKLPDNQPFVFGQLPLAADSSLQQLQRDIEVLKKVIIIQDSKLKVAKVLEDLKAKEGPGIEEKKREIEELVYATKSQSSSQSP